MPRFLALAITLSSAVLLAQQPAPLPRADANGNPLRRAEKTGHVSNYDETKVGSFELPDPLKFADGRPVRTPKEWSDQRRTEIIRAYEHDIFGRMPSTTPRVTWVVTEDHGPKKLIVG